jgi:hypothetical protein
MFVVLSPEDDAILVGSSLMWMVIALLRGDHPVGVGVEEEEEDHAESHQVHVDEEEDSAVVEVPAALHAADGVGGADDGEQDGKDEEWGGAVVGEVGEEESDGETEENEETAA